jgi:hypothetical protein
LTFGPARVSVCGLVDALLVMVTVPEVPMTVGTNATVMVHVPPGGSVVMQLSVSVKLPLVATPVMTRSSVPLLLNVDV